MSRDTLLRLIATVVVIIGIFVFALRSTLDPARLSILLTAAICAATVLYASLTFEILLRNQYMAQAAGESAKLMEQGLRFSHASNLLYRTIITKDPTLKSWDGCTPVANEDYKNALKFIEGMEGQSEFVFCIVKNVGHGAATNLRISTQYTIHDTSNAMARLDVPKVADIQLLEPSKSIALLIYLFKVPTADDTAEIVQAILRSSDTYRDAIHELPLTINITRDNHQSQLESGCTARLG
jgi:hypothetical protein